MTGVARPINVSAGSPSYPARAWRNADAAKMMWDGVPMAGRQGVRPMGGTAANIVTLSGSTITVGLHACEVTPGWAAVTGTYDCALTATETHSLTPAHATNPRKDIVFGQVWDHDESASGFRKYESVYLAGTAGPSPSEPAVPVGGIKLATIDVPASGGGSPVVTNNYTRTAANGGILPVRTEAERNAIVNPAVGQTVYRDEKKWLECHDGTAWRVFPNIVSFGVTTEFTHPVAGQVGYHIPTGKFWGYNGSAWIPQSIAHQVVEPGFQTTTSATYVAITGDPGTSFMAPLTGQVWVEVSSAMASDATATARAAFQVRTGGTVGTGTIVYTVTNNDSISSAGSTGWEGGRGGALVPGLTPGTTYNAQMLYLREGTGTAGFARRKITIKDA